MSETVEIERKHLACLYGMARLYTEEDGTDVYNGDESALEAANQRLNRGDA